MSTISKDHIGRIVDTRSMKRIFSLDEVPESLARRLAMLNNPQTFSDYSPLKSS